MEKKRLIIWIAGAAILIFTAFCLYNPRWFFHTFTPTKMRCGEITELYLSDDVGYVVILEKELKRYVTYPVTKTIYVNSRIGDYTCKRLSDWEVNN